MKLFSEIQIEVGEWSSENFPGQEDINPLIGADEEMGELADTIEFDSEPDDEEIDAVGDILIFLADFCSIRGLDYQHAYELSQDRSPEHDDIFQEWAGAKGQLNCSVLKQRQGIKLDRDTVGKEAEHNALARIICTLDMFANNRGYTIEDAINFAWYDEVIDRDWDSSYRNSN
jgi:hypothetical protein